LTVSMTECFKPRSAQKSVTCPAMKTRTTVIVVRHLASPDRALLKNRKLICVLLPVVCMVAAQQRS
jgi:hypothetical protein